MKYFFAIILMLTSLWASAQQRPAQLDSLRRVLDTTQQLSLKVPAITAIMSHFSLIPDMDSLHRYAQKCYALAPNAPFPTYLTLPYQAHFALGGGYFHQGKYAEAREEYIRCQELLQQLTAKDTANKQQAYLKRSRQVLEGNLANTYNQLGQHQAAMRLYDARLVRDSIAADTLGQVITMLNEAVLYGRMSSVATPDSAERLFYMRNRYTNHGITLARAYLVFHPTQLDMQRYLLYLLANKAQTIGESDVADAAVRVSTPRTQISEAEREETLKLVMESLLLARKSGVPGRNLLVPMPGLVQLLNQAGRLPQALKYANELLHTADSLKMPEFEARGYDARSITYWQMKEYEKSIQDALTATHKYAENNDLVYAFTISEAFAQRIKGAPWAVQRKFRREAEELHALSEVYRKQVIESENK